MRTTPVRGREQLAEEDPAGFRGGRRQPERRLYPARHADEHGIARVVERVRGVNPRGGDEVGLEHGAVRLLTLAEFVEAEVRDGAHGPDSEWTLPVTRGDVEHGTQVRSAAQSAGPLASHPHDAMRRRQP